MISSFVESVQGEIAVAINVKVTVPPSISAMPGV
jgi:hypothetical protein